MKFNPTAFNSIHDRRYSNWDGLSLVYTYDFIDVIKNYIDLYNIDVIFDIGSRDCCQSLELADWFPESKIFAFEPVDSNADWCQKSIYNRNNIQFFKSAISKIDGIVSFYEVTNGNIGASSLLQKNDGHAYGASYEQKEISVQSIRGDSFLSKNNIDKLDLIWMDVQGSEIEVLDSFGEYLNNIKAIHTEVGLSEVYKQSTVKNDLIQYLQQKGFTLKKSISNSLNIEEDCIFINNKFLS